MLKGENRQGENNSSRGSGEPRLNIPAAETRPSGSPHTDALRKAPTATRLAYFAVSLVRRQSAQQRKARAAAVSRPN